jgi:hypothetical protein
MDICSACGKLFLRAYVPLCGSCVVNESNRFDLVREFLRDNPGASLSEMAEGTGLSRGEVARYHAEGRLVEVDPAREPSPLECSCTPGKRCLHCRHQLARSFDSMKSTFDPNHSRIRFPAPRSASADDDRTRYVRRRHRND